MYYITVYIFIKLKPHELRYASLVGCTPPELDLQTTKTYAITVTVTKLLYKYFKCEYFYFILVVLLSVRAIAFISNSDRCISISYQPGDGVSYLSPPLL